MMAHGIVPGRVASATRTGLEPVARAFVRAGVSANAVTLGGVALTVAGSALVALERPVAATAVMIVAAVADSLDGAIARASGGGSRLGAFLDSTSDRIADAALLSGAAWVGASRGDAVLFWGALAALIASSLVSYVRAKAESLGAQATLGPAPREARLVILLGGLALWAVGIPLAFVAAVVVVAILATLTAALRIAAVSKSLAATGK